jgi:hypothetical protein
VSISCCYTLLPTPSVKPFNNRNQNIKKISPAEIQLRREKNLCYFMLLQLETEDESQSQTPLPADEEAILEEDTHHLSLNAMRGSNGVGRYH